LLWRLLRHLLLGLLVLLSVLPCLTKLAVIVGVVCGPCSCRRVLTFAGVTSTRSTGLLTLGWELLVVVATPALRGLEAAALIVGAWSTLRSSVLVIASRALRSGASVWSTRTTLGRASRTPRAAWTSRSSWPTLEHVIVGTIIGQASFLTDELDCHLDLLGVATDVEVLLVGVGPWLAL